MSPHRRVYINYSSTLEVMGTQLQMLEKQKMKARSAADGTQLHRSNCAEARLLRSLAPHYGLFTSLSATLHCNQRPVTNRAKQPNKQGK